MADQGFDDFVLLTCTTNRLISQANAIIQEVDKLTEIRTDILEDPERLSGVSDYINLHDDYTLAGLNNLYNKLKDIRDYIEGKSL